MKQVKIARNIAFLAPVLNSDIKKAPIF